MKILNVQLLVNRITDDLTPYLAYVYQYNLKHGIELHFDIKQVNVTGYQSISVPIAAGGNGYILNGADKLLTLDTEHDVNMFIFDLNEWKAPWYSFYPLRSDTPRSSCILVNNKPFINLGFYSKDMPGTQITMVHELMHAYTKIAVSEGFTVIDQMDTYYLNSTPDAANGNFAIQWSNLQSWNIPQVINSNTVLIKRNSDNGVETLGTLTFGPFTCSTLERPWLNNQHDISCIPKGTYHCTIQPFHTTHMYELSPTSPRTGIFIHPANYVTDLLGCIALGISPSDINHDGQIDVTSSVNTVSEFMKLTDGQPITLIIS